MTGDAGLPFAVADATEVAMTLIGGITIVYGQRYAVAWSGDRTARECPLTYQGGNYSVRGNPCGAWLADDGQGTVIPWRLIVGACPTER